MAMKKKKRRKIAWRLALLAFGIFFAAAGCGNGNADTKAALPPIDDERFPDDAMKDYARKMLGSKVPDFTLADLAGSKVSLSSFKGQPVVLEFAKTTCPYCRAVQPVAEEAAGMRPDVAFVQAFLSNTREEVAAYLAETGTGSTVIVVLTGDAGDEPGEIRERFGHFPYVPLFLFIDGDGTIVDMRFGSFDLATMEQSLSLAFPSGKEG